MPDDPATPRPLPPDLGHPYRYLVDRGSIVPLDDSYRCMTPTRRGAAHLAPACVPRYARSGEIIDGTEDMLIRIGYEITYGCPQPTPMVVTLNVHFSRVSDLVRPDNILTNPATPVDAYRDGFGNWCGRLVALPGDLTISADALIRDDGLPDPADTMAIQHAVQDLPADTLLYLQGSRYCETDCLSETAWQLFQHTPPGWARVQAICDFVHGHVQFGYHHARATRTAQETYHERIGVCRDYAHLAVAFCRAMNIPARYCTGYLGDIGIPPAPEPMDFAAWFEAYLGGRWHTFDPRNNARRIGRVLMARGRDAADVPITHAFGQTELKGFRVWTDEISGPA